MCLRSLFRNFRAKSKHTIIYFSMTWRNMTPLTFPVALLMAISITVLSLSNTPNFHFLPLKIPFVFVNHYYDSYWTPLVEQIGIDRTPHGTRHICISMLSEAGVQDTTIKKIVGNSGAITLTEKVYTRLDMQVLVDAINKTLEDEGSVTADTKSA